MTDFDRLDAELAAAKAWWNDTIEQQGDRQADILPGRDDRARPPEDGWAGYYLVDSIETLVRSGHLVEITGPGGKDWTAIYEMRLMDDGSYKVNGVRMLIAASGGVRIEDEYRYLIATA